jgi:murein DD-endopeptidase MepM/ murein hydrolase activator NlpD
MALAAAAAVVVIGVAVVTLGVVPGSDDGSSATGAAPAEPELDGVTPAPAKRAEEVAGADSASPKVVQVRPPGGTAQATGGDSEEPPERIKRENADIRKQLDHLKALERERARVSRTLLRAGAIYDGPVRLGPGGLAWPVGGGVVSPFGQRWGRLHAGVDIAARAGTVIHAAQDGLVVIAGPTGGYGNYVCVQHTKELTTCYAHLSRFGTRRGEVVRQGDPLGLVGCTGHCFGDHLHFETWVRGRPVDPMRWF